MNRRITYLATLFLLLSLSGLILPLSSADRDVTPAPGASGGQLHVRKSTGQQVNRSASQQVHIPHSEFRIPHSKNPQSAIRNPQSVGLPLFFEPNRGQAEDSIQFVSGGSGLRLSFRRDALIFAPSSSASQQSRVAMRFVGSNSSPEIVGEEPLPGKSNYLIGNNPSQWKTDVPQYAKVRYKEIYPGIDLIFYGNQQQLEYDLVVSPGVDPSVIKFGYTVDSPQSLDAAKAATKR